jgi:hypothetical protein
VSRFVLALGALVWLVTPCLASAQQTDSTDTRRQRLRTRDGSTLVGRVVAESADSVRFASLGAVITLSRAQILSLDTLGAGPEKTRSEHLYRDPNRTRLFFAPTGRMLAKGEGYFSDSDVLLAGVAGGVTSNFTMGGGMSLIPSDNPTNNILYLTPKIGLVDRPNFALAAGAVIGFAGFEGIDEKDRNLGIIYGVSTFGPEDHHLDIGAGWGYAGGRISGDPAIMVGGSTRVSRRVALLTENYVVPSISDNALVSYGVRFLGKDISVDLAFANLVGPNTTLLFPGVPYVGFAVKF